MKREKREAVDTANSTRNLSAPAERHLICLDPGSRTCGLVEIIDCDIVHAGNYGPQEAINYILEVAGRAQITVIYEDVQYYSVRIGRSILDTCKYIGEFEYRMKLAGVPIIAVLRWQVKNWIFKTFPEISGARIKQKIDSGRIKRKDGGKVTSKFFFVDDRIAIAAMKYCWGIPTPRPGQKSKYGLSKHSWQALATATYVIVQNGWDQVR